MGKRIKKTVKKVSSKLEQQRIEKAIERNVPIEELKPWKDNPRINEDSIERLAELIQAHGFAGVIVASPDGTIRAGHSRYEAVKRLGWKTIDVNWKEFPSEKAAIAFSLADNKSSEWAEWDKGKLAKIFAKNNKRDLKLLSELSGFKKSEIVWEVDIDKESVKEENDDEEKTYILRVDNVAYADVKKLQKSIQEILEDIKFKKIKSLKLEIAEVLKRFRINDKKTQNRIQKAFDEAGILYDVKVY